MRNAITAYPSYLRIEFRPGEWAAKQVRDIKKNVAVEDDQVSWNLSAGVHELGTSMSPATLLLDSLRLILVGIVKVGTAPDIFSRLGKLISER